MDITQEQLKALVEGIGGLVVQNAPPEKVAAVKNKLLVIRDLNVKVVAAIKEALDIMNGNADAPVSDVAVPPVEIAPPKSLDPPVEAPKKSKWAKVGGFFKKVWPVASIALVTAVPGGAAIAAGVNAVMGAGTADPVSAGAAGLLVPIGAAIVKGMEKSKE